MLSHATTLQQLDHPPFLATTFSEPDGITVWTQIARIAGQMRLAERQGDAADAACLHAVSQGDSSEAARQDHANRTAWDSYEALQAALSITPAVTLDDALTLVVAAHELSASLDACERPPGGHPEEVAIGRMLAEAARFLSGHGARTPLQDGLPNRNPGR